jgi:hypothetical protein
MGVQILFLPADLPLTWDHNNIKTVLKNTKKKLQRAIQNKRCGMLTSGAVLLHDNARLYTAARIRALLKHFNWELLDHPSYSLALSLWVTIACLPIWRTGCDHSASAIMRSWWKGSKCGWTHRRQTSLTQAYTSLFLNMTSASILAVTTLRSVLSMYVFFGIQHFFSLFFWQLTRGSFPNSPRTMLHTLSKFVIPRYKGKSGRYTWRSALKGKCWSLHHLIMLYQLWRSYSFKWDGHY